MTTRGTRAIAQAGGRAYPRRARSGASPKKRIKTALALALLAAESALAIALVCLTILFWRFTNEDLTGLESIADAIRTPVATTIWSEDGVLLGRLEVQNRQPIALEKIPKRMRDATIAIEDHRFYEHAGVDPVGVVRALVANVRSSNHASQGGSTLTQQLVRNINQFGVSKEKRLGRKVREAFTAIRLEQLYTKNEILGLYLNNIYYGGGAYGVEAAAQAYFGKAVAKLDISESALLAGLPQRPRDFTPFDHKKAALKRRDEVLDKMLEYGDITRQEHDHAVRETLHFLKRQARKNYEFKAPYFVTYVLRQLIRQYKAEYVYSGIKIETTLNWKMQQMAEAALRNGLANASGLGANQGALVAIDNKTGYIRAMVGGRSFASDQYNAVTQGRRQPGSTFKIFDYSAAFDMGRASLYTSFPDKPIPYPNDPQGRVVKNYDGGYSYGSISCLTAIQFSKNTIAVQAAQAAGIRNVIKYAKRMGITTSLAPYLPTALGASAVRPLDLASAYSVIPMQGKRCKPMAVTRVSDPNLNTEDERTPIVVENILKPDTAASMNQAFHAVVESGTGTLARGREANGIVEDAAGKTGTTSDNRDAWFAGYTPELTAVIWVASVHKYHGRVTYASMGGATGGHLCAPIWHDFMVGAAPLERQFKTPAPGIVIDGGKAVTAPPARHRKTWTPAPQTTPDESADSNDTGDSGDNGGNAPQNDENKMNGPAPTDPNADGGDTGDDKTPATAPEGTAPPLPEPDNGDGGTLPTSTPKPAPAPRPRPKPPENPPHADNNAAPGMITVQICNESGRLANAYCPAFHPLRITAAQKKRMGRCKTHRPPPGEE